VSDIWKTVTSPLWVVTTVLVSLLLNVFSGYLKDGLDRLLQHLFKRREESAGKRRRERMEMFDKLITDREYRTDMRVDQIRQEFVAYACNVIATFSGLMVILPAVHVTPLLDRPLSFQISAKFVTAMWALSALVMGSSVMLGMKYRQSAMRKKIQLAITEDYVLSDQATTTD
jgi:hypothetical protein